MKFILMLVGFMAAVMMVSGIMGSEIKTFALGLLFLLVSLIMSRYTKKEKVV